MLPSRGLPAARAAPRAVAKFLPRVVEAPPGRATPIAGAVPTGGAVPDGEFEGYASLFGQPDLGRDVVMPGAFAASLARRGPRGVRMLWQHDPGEPIGAWLDLAEDARGLRVRGRLNLGVRRARDVHALMREGALDGLSIGFRVERAAPDRVSGLRRLERLDLWEVSLVTFPMLPGARIGPVSGSVSGPIPRTRPLTPA